MAQEIVRSCTVYGLRDSRDGVVRYIGQTSSSLARRMYAHICESKTGTEPKHAWIRSGRAEGGIVEIFALVENADKDAEEVRQIEAHRASGLILFNVTGGGAGLSQCTDSTRLKLSASTYRRFTDSAERAKTSAGTRSAMQRPEVLEKLALAARARWSDEEAKADQAKKVSERFECPKQRADQSDRTAKLTNDQVIEARRLRRAGYKLSELCEIYGLCKASMSALCSGKTFKHLPL
ncbi:hypothetical protein [Pseudomonas veronii]